LSNDTWGNKETKKKEDRDRPYKRAVRNAIAVKESNMQKDNWTKEAIDKDI